jgi:hypothetical protein
MRLFGRLLLSRGFWAGVLALWAAIMLALGLTMGPPTWLSGWRWVCYPAGMGCLALSILLRDKHRVLENLLLALAAAWLVAGLLLPWAGW